MAYDGVLRREVLSTTVASSYKLTGASCMDFAAKCSAESHQVSYAGKVNSFDAIANIEETTQSQTKLVLDTINDEVAYVLNNTNVINMSHNQPSNAIFNVNKEAIHRDSFNETETTVKIVDVHSDESLIPYYTVRFQNGKERITTSDCLRK